MASGEETTSMDLERTSWRGWTVSRPPGWELTRAVAVGEPWIMAFGSEGRERMRVQWRPLSYTPDLRRAIGRRETEPGTHDISGLPAGWQGTGSCQGSGHVTHAGRFFEGPRMLVEAMLAWPEGRDERLERAILEAVGPEPVRAGAVVWRAMGISAAIPSGFSLTDFRAEAARVEWRFRSESGVSAVVDRLGVPRYWLQTSLAEWLEANVAPGFSLLRAAPTRVNGHPAAEVLCVGPSRGLDRLRGRRVIRREVAWLCPAEERVYRLQCEAVARRPVLEFPAGLSVECCAPAASIPAVPRRVSESLPVLTGVPVVNAAATITPRGRGGLMASVPVRRPAFMVRPLTWILPFSSVRRVDLDTLGAAILGQCDGTRSVSDIAAWFAAENRLTAREAELSVLQFIRQLSERGVLVVAGLKEAGSA